MGRRQSASDTSPGEIIGTTVSGTFLYLIAILNIIILTGIVRVFQDMRTGRYNDDELERRLRLIDGRLCSNTPCGFL